MRRERKAVEIRFTGHVTTVRTFHCFCRCSGVRLEGEAPTIAMVAGVEQGTTPTPTTTAGVEVPRISTTGNQNSRRYSTTVCPFADFSLRESVWAPSLFFLRLELPHGVGTWSRLISATRIGQVPPAGTVFWSVRVQKIIVRASPK